MFARGGNQYNPRKRGETRGVSREEEEKGIHGNICCMKNENCEQQSETTGARSGSIMKSIVIRKSVDYRTTLSNESCKLTTVKWGRVSQAGNGQIHYHLVSSVFFLVFCFLFFKINSHPLGEHHQQFWTISKREKNNVCCVACWWCE